MSIDFKNSAYLALILSLLVISSKDRIISQLKLTDIDETGFLRENKTIVIVFSCPFHLILHRETRCTSYIKQLCMPIKNY